jgi:hypothetical protein
VGTSDCRTEKESCSNGMDKSIKWMEFKNSDMEKMTTLKKEVIDDMRKTQKMLKQ